MRVAILGAALALSACATDARTSASLHGSLDPLVGQPVEVAVARLGEPIAVATMGADKVYGWGLASTGSEYAPATSQVVAPADFQGGVFPAPRRPVQQACVIRMVAGADGLVRSWDREGDERGCRALAERLAGPEVARLD